MKYAYVLGVEMKGRTSTEKCESCPLPDRVALNKYVVHNRRSSFVSIESTCIFSPLKRRIIYLYLPRFSIHVRGWMCWANLFFRFNVWRQYSCKTCRSLNQELSPEATELWVPYNSSKLAFMVITDLRQVREYQGSNILAKKMSDSFQCARIVDFSNEIVFETWDLNACGNGVWNFFQILLDFKAQTFANKPIPCKVQSGGNVEFLVTPPISFASSARFKTVARD